jgi:hypothetical protein
MLYCILGYDTASAAVRSWVGAKGGGLSGRISGPPPFFRRCAAQLMNDSQAHTTFWDMALIVVSFWGGSFFGEWWKRRERRRLEVRNPEPPVDPAPPERP